MEYDLTPFEKPTWRTPVEDYIRKKKDARKVRKQSEIGEHPVTTVQAENVRRSTCEEKKGQTKTDKTEDKLLSDKTVNREESNIAGLCQALAKSEPFQPAEKRTPYLNLEHGFLRSIKHRLFKNKELFSKCLNDSPKPLYRPTKKEESITDTCKHPDTQNMGVKSSSGPTLTTKGEEQVPIVKKTIGFVSESKVLQFIKSQKSIPLTAVKSEKSDKESLVTTNGKMRSKKRPTRQIYIPPNKRTGSNNDLFEHYIRTPTERLPKCNGGNTEQDINDFQPDDTPTVNMIQGRAARDKYKKHRRDSCSDQHSQCSSPTTPCSDLDLEDSKSTQRGDEDGDFKDTITVHVLEDSTVNQEPPLDVHHLDIFPHDIRNLLEQVYKGVELEEEEKDTLAKGLVLSGVEDSENAAMAARVCSRLMQMDISRTESPSSGSREPDLEDCLLTALVAAFYQHRERGESMLLFCASLLGCLGHCARPAWKFLPIIVLSMLELLTADPSWASEHVTVQLVADVLCRCGRKLESESEQYVDKIMLSLRGMLLATGAPIGLRRKLLLLMELRASGWRLDEDTVNFYNILQT